MRNSVIRANRPTIPLHISGEIHISRTADRAGAEVDARSGECKRAVNVLTAEFDETRAGEDGAGVWSIPFEPKINVPPASTLIVPEFSSGEFQLIDGVTLTDPSIADQVIRADAAKKCRCRQGSRRHQLG